MGEVTLLEQLIGSRAQGVLAEEEAQRQILLAKLRAERFNGMWWQTKPHPPAADSVDEIERRRKALRREIG